MEAGSFYTGAAGPLDQGDLLVAPLLRPINPAEPAPVDNFSRTPWLQIDETVSLKGVPPHDVLAAVQAAIVVSHGCHIDKQYNQRVDDLHRKQGLPLAEARRQAEADRTLDRWIAVSPVVPLDAVSADETAIAQRKAIGLFHIPAHPDGIVAVPAVADLSVKFTVDRTLTRRVSCLTAEARDELRMALMRVDLARKPAWDALEHALGSKLRDVVVDERHPLLVTLRFANGEELQLAHRPADGAEGGRSRL